MRSALLVFVFLALAAPPAAQGPGVAAAGDYVTIDRLRYRDRIEADGRSERSTEMKILLRDGAAVAQFGQVAAPYVDGYGDAAFEDVVIEKPGGRRIEVTNGVLEDVNPFGITGSSISADVRFKKLTIPGLEPRGSPLVPRRAPAEPARPGPDLRRDDVPGQ